MFWFEKKKSVSTQARLRESEFSSIYILCLTWKGGEERKYTALSQGIDDHLIVIWSLEMVE